MTFVSVNHLTKTYSQGADFLHALNDVSFSVEKGEFVAIVGPSGSGKSTLLHLLSGIDRPTSGTVWIEGIDLFLLPEPKLTLFRRKKIGLVYQFFNLVPMLSVKENLVLPLLLDGKRVADKDIETMAKRLGIFEKINSFPSNLSGGQQQRVAIGRALITSPSLFLADEPTGNLDSESTENIMQLLCSFHQGTNQTMILITHNPAIAKRADRIITLKDGRLFQCEDKV